MGPSEILKFLDDFFGETKLVNPYLDKTLKEAREIYASYDKNGDGKISRIEMK